MATLKAVLKDKKKDNTYNVKILVVHNQKNAYIKTKYYLKKNQLRNNRVVNHPNADIYNDKLSQLINKYERRLLDISTKLGNLSVLDIKDYLESELIQNEIEFFDYVDGVISELTKKYEAELKRNGKASNRTADCYTSLKNGIQEFIKPRSELLFRHIDKKFLESYEQFLRDRGTNSGVWNQMKDLRALFNRLISDERQLLSPEYYPFKYYNVNALKKDSEPRVIDLDDLRSLFTICPLNNDEAFALDVFKLDFFLIGINAVDLYHLENNGGYIANGRVFFDRSKTEVGHSIKIEPEALELINKLRGKTKYFSFQERYSTVNNFTKYMAKFLRRIADDLKIPEFTLGYARYTWATVAFNECEVPESIIDFALGHKLSKTLAGAHYIKKKRGLMDDANRKVIDMVIYLP
ncbi:MAG: hypothetical protein CVU09_00475 [Bacteroidetes bacterium HGW-Bacteroidetes-4]|jgi:integrase|nr:MAG: hypothetical protein CVU09_00475 [Bacteroidetes bacterium HGW-Bacteroidetes-4]